jgi:hypothetical protein
MKTAWSENPNSRIRLCTEPSPWGGRSKPSSLIHRGWKEGKYPAAREVFFLTFPFIELLRPYRGAAMKTIRENMASNLPTDEDL